MPTWNCINANAQALARYAALCQEAGIVPIVEPEVLMDGPVATHDIDACYAATEWILKTVFQELYVAHVEARGHGAQAEHGGRPARRARSRPRPAEVAEKTVARPQGMRARGGRRHRLPVRRAEQRGGDRAPQPDQPDRPVCPGRVTFSYGRALQAAAIETWAGKAENVAAAQRAFNHRAQHEQPCRHRETGNQISRKRQPDVPQMPEFVVC